MHDIPMQETNNPNYSDQTVKNEKCVAEEEMEKKFLEEGNEKIAITGYIETHGPVKKKKDNTVSEDRKKNN